MRQRLAALGGECLVSSRARRRGGPAVKMRIPAESKKLANKSWKKIITVSIVGRRS